VLITNRKSYMRFLLVPKSVTLNDLERRNGPYFALFQRICVRCRRKTSTSFQNLLLIVCDHIAQLFSDYLGKTNSDNSV